MLLAGFVTLCPAGHAQDAQQIYADVRSKVFQILIIDRQSQEKAAIGSGFLVAPGMVATNFHVVSEAIHQPDKYRIEIKSESGAIGTLTIVDFDIVHDLALTEVSSLDPIQNFDTSAANNSQGHLNEPLLIAPQQPAQGADIYSLGNPFDLGHTIIPGTYNGLLEQSFYQRIHFSGSL